jgi:hypothetical protein
MVVHATRHHHHRSEALERPPLRRLKAHVQGPLREDGQYTLPLPNAQAGGTAGKGACAQAGHLALMLVELLSPLAHSHPTDAQAAGNVGVGESSGLEKPAGF